MLYGSVNICVAECTVLTIRNTIKFCVNHPKVLNNTGIKIVSV